MSEDLVQISVLNGKGEAVTLVSDGRELLVDTGRDFSARMQLDELKLDADPRDDGSATIMILYKGLNFDYETQPGTVEELNRFLDTYLQPTATDDDVVGGSLQSYQQEVLEGRNAGTEASPSSWLSPEIGPRVSRVTPDGVPRWEYLSLQRSTNNLAAMMGDLNVQGEKGWELVSLTFLDRTLGLNSIVAVLKRPIA